MHNFDVRRKILELLYEQCKEHPYSRLTPKEFRELLGIGLKELNFNMIYLESKGFVELQRLLEGNLFVGARITAKGIDLVEDEYEFSITFPIDDTASAPVTVFSQFALLIDDVMTNSEFGEQTMEIIIAHIEEIAEELRRNDVSYSAVKQHVAAIRKLNQSVFDRIISIMRHPVIARILTTSARKEMENP